MDFKPEDFEVESKFLLDEELKKQLKFKNELIYVPWDLALDGRLSHGAFRLYMILKKFAELDNNKSRAFPTRKHLAKMMGISSRQVDTLKNQLKYAGYLYWTKEPGKQEEKPWHNVYILKGAFQPALNVDMGEENFSHRRKLPTTNRVVGLSPTPTLIATGVGDSPKRKKISRKKFIELVDKEVCDWKIHYQLFYEEGQWYYYGLSQEFSNWLNDNEKDYLGDNFDSLKIFPWERKLELLKKFQIDRSSIR
jgi:hypothetical protein